MGPRPNGDSDESARSSALPADTSFHARRVLAGDLKSLDWLVRRLSPLLLVQAERRLGTTLRRLCEPEDLVAEVWLDSLPKLGDLDASPQRHAALVVRYLSTVLLGRVRNLARKAAVRGPRSSDVDPAEDERSRSDTTGVVSRAIRAERRSVVWTALEHLDPADRDLIVFRGIEQRPNDEVAAVLGLRPGHVAVRYHRALKKLRDELPHSVFDDLPDDPAP